MKNVVMIKSVSGEEVLAELISVVDGELHLKNPVLLRKLPDPRMVLVARYFSLSYQTEIQFPRHSYISYAKVNHHAVPYYEAMLRYIEEVIDPGLVQDMEMGIQNINKTIELAKEFESMAPSQELLNENKEGILQRIHKSANTKLN